MTKQQGTGAAAVPTDRSADILWLPRHPQATALRRAAAALEAAGRSLASTAASMSGSVGSLTETLARIDAERARSYRLEADAATVADAIASGDLAVMAALRARLLAALGAEAPVADGGAAGIAARPDRRRHQRSGSDQPVTIRHRARRIDARLVDVSRGGAALTFGDPLGIPEGSAVVIDGASPFRGGIDARVVGLGDGRLRIAFDPEMVAHGLFDPTPGAARGGA